MREVALDCRFTDCTHLADPIAASKPPSTKAGSRPAATPATKVSPRVPRRVLAASASGICYPFPKS